MILTICKQILHRLCPDGPNGPQRRTNPKWTSKPVQATKTTPTNNRANKNVILARSIEEVAAIGRQYKEFATKAGRLAEQQPLSANGCKELATAIAHATEAYKYGKKLGKLVQGKVLGRLATAKLCVNKLLAKADMLLEQQHSSVEEEKEVHATIERAKEMADAMKVLGKHMAKLVHG